MSKFYARNLAAAAVSCKQYGTRYIQLHIYSLRTNRNGSYYADKMYMGRGGGRSEIHVSVVQGSLTAAAMRGMVVSDR